MIDDRLIIYVAEGSDGALSMFPFKDGQYLDYELCYEDGTVCVVCLGDEEDVTDAQYEYLLYESRVISWDFGLPDLLLGY